MIFELILLFAFLPKHDGDVNDTLPSLNLWELCLGLSADPSLCNLAGITEAEARAAAMKLSSSKLDPLISKRMDVVGIDKMQKVFLEFDPLVRVELQGILSEDQLKVARRLRLASRFSSAVESLSDVEVLDFAGLDDLKKRKLGPLLSEFGKKYAKELATLQTESAIEFFRSLPRVQQELLAQYLGSSFETGIEIAGNLPVASLPFENSFFHPSLLSASEIRSRLNMTPSQVEQLKASETRFRERLSTPKRNYREHFEQCFLDAKKDMGELFSNEQLLDCIRFIALTEFKRDLSKPMKRETMARYLKMDKPEGLSAFRNIADLVNEELKEKVSSLNRKYFAKIADELDPEPQRRLMGLFAKVWLLEVP